MEERIYYEESADYKMSKNFNSVGGSVIFGRTAKKGESREKLIKDVNTFVEKRVYQKIKNSDILLNEIV